MPSVVAVSPENRAEYPEARADAGRRWRPRLPLTPSAQRELILALLLLLCYGFFRQIPAWNEYSRYDLVVALVDDRTMRIDRYHENTGDKAFYGGHYYSDKPPAAALLGVPVYAAMRAVAALAGAATPDARQVMHMLAFAVSGIPTVLLALLLLRFLRPLVGEWWALAMVVGYALGTMAFPFATMYFAHAAAAFFLFAAFYCLRRAPGDGRGWRAPVAGALAGWAVLSEYPAALGLAVLLAYALWLSRRHAVLFVVGGLPALALLLLFNWLQLGNPFELSYRYHVSFGQQIQSGLFGIGAPKLSLLGEVTFGSRGLLRHSPWLSLAPLGLWAARRRDIRREVLICGAMALVFLVYNAGYFAPYGGWSPGPRYLSPALPFATVLVGLAPRAFRPLVGLQLVYSVLLFLVATATMPNAPEAVRDPLGELWLPRFLSRNLADTTAWLHWGLHGIQPLLVLLGAAAIAAVALLATTQPTPAARGLRLAGVGLLVLLVAAFGSPVAPVADALAGGTAAEGARIAILDAGVTRLPAGERELKVVPWAQLENRGGGLADTSVVFSVYAPSGQQVWAAWHGHVRWQPGERKRLAVEWSPRDLAPGNYRVAVAVQSADQQTTFASVEDAARIRVGP